MGYWWQKKYFEKIVVVNNQDLEEEERKEALEFTTKGDNNINSNEWTGESDETGSKGWPD